MSVVLETRGLGKRFGGLLATNDVSFQLERGARQALIGPNGAGKTTFVNLLTGVLPPSAGQVLLLGEDVTRLRPEARVRRGLVRTFQINQLFGDLTPLETLALAVGERLGLGRDWRRRVGAVDAVSAEAFWTYSTGAPTPCLTASSDCSRSPRPSPARRKSCCSTSPRPACPRSNGATY
jgi:ABC-type branched-subunit amino acid transport system ATPase component